MNVGQLKAMLEDLDLPNEDEVRIMIQPSWPLQFKVAGLHVDDDNQIVYLVQGSHPDETPYGSEYAWDALEFPEDYE